MIVDMKTIEYAHEFVNPVLRAAHKSGEIIDDNLTIVRCKDTGREVVAIIEENGEELHLHNEDVDDEWADVKYFKRYSQSL